MDMIISLDAERTFDKISELAIYEDGYKVLSTS